MKKHIIHFVGLIIISAIAVVASSSCEKVITVDLNTAAPSVVIEANITNQPGPYTITITKTGSYFDNTPLPRVSGAKVIISDEAGPKDTLTEVSAGIYKTTHIQGITGHTYTMSVTAEGKEYHATSTMPDTVSISYLTYELRQGRPNSSDSTGYHVHCHFTDPAAIRNYYRAVVYVRDTLQNQPDNLTNFEDNLSDGRSINLTLRGQSFKIDDTTRVDLISVDEHVYDYFKVLRMVIDAGGPNSTSTPQNPPSNISNGAVGYFSASAITTSHGIVHQ